MKIRRRISRLASYIAAFLDKLRDKAVIRRVISIMLGAMLCTFGIHNIHERTNITEGGIIGLVLLIDH